MTVVQWSVAPLCRLNRHGSSSCGKTEPSVISEMVNSYRYALAKLVTEIAISLFLRQSSDGGTYDSLESG